MVTFFYILVVSFFIVAYWIYVRECRKLDREYDELMASFEVERQRLFAEHADRLKEIERERQRIEKRLHVILKDIHPRQ